MSVDQLIDQQVEIFNLKSEIQRLSSQIEILIVDSVKDKSKIEYLQSEIESLKKINHSITNLLQEYLEFFGRII